MVETAERVAWFMACVIAFVIGMKAERERDRG